ncbi:ATPase, T2SS/T4P/T4SS family [Escherichia coli]|uniref:ATPase, T2SS/T4P/T4SS family n=1 Tax=Escherichia coli TaxID=562 RepID=UPI00244E4534|nr:ATPase, T2SS/T4P/T4SS family [Escherichia coli]
MRLIPDDGSAPPSLETLGFLPAQIAVIHAMLASPDAIIINSGPTGSGKSTTGRSFMALWLQHGNGQRRIITQEDPVEGGSRRGHPHLGDRRPLQRGGHQPRLAAWSSCHTPSGPGCGLYR